MGLSNHSCLSSLRNENLHLHRNLHMNVHSSFICYSPNWNSPQYPLIGEWLNQLVHPYHTILLGNTQEWIIHTLSNFESPVIYDEWKEANLKRLHAVWFRLYNIFELTSGCQGLRMGLGVDRSGYDYERATSRILMMLKLFNQHLDCVVDMWTHLGDNTHTHTYTRKIWEIWISQWIGAVPIS